MPLSMDWVYDLMLPATDGGVVLQLTVVLVLAVGAVWMTRARRDWRLVSIGAGLLAVGLIGLRALH